MANGEARALLTQGSGEPGPRRARSAAIAVAATSALLAAAMVAAVASQVGRNSTSRATLIQALRGTRPGASHSPVQYYYIPASEAKALVSQQEQLSKKLDKAAAGVAGASQQYSVFNTGAAVSEPSAKRPKTASVKKAVTRMQLPDNFHWGTDGQGLDPEWKCTIPNLVALYNFVQPEWEKCKENGNYVEPNKPENTTNATDAGDGGDEAEEAPAEEASPSTIGWLYKEVEGHDVTSADIVKARRYKAQAQKFIKHKLLSGPSAVQEIEGYFGGSHSRRLLTNWDKAPVLDASSPTMKQCLDFALGNLCSMLSTCDDPVCDNYYNETEIEGLCGMCEMRIGTKEKGCFSVDAPVSAARGEVAVGDLRVGDMIKSVSDGVVGWSRVVFLHDHEEPAATLALKIGGREGGRRLELTAPHLIHVQKAGGEGSMLMPARNVKVGDAVHVVEGGDIRVASVLDISVQRSMVRYVVTDNDAMLVDGVVAAVYSTGAGWLETLPFRLLDRLLPGVFGLAAVKSSLFAVLESPILNAFEKVVNTASAASAAFGAPPLAHTPANAATFQACELDSVY